MQRQTPKRRKTKQTVLNEQAVDALLDKLGQRGKRALSTEDFDALHGVVQTWAHLTELAAQPKASIRAIRRALGIAEPRGTEAPTQTDDSTELSDSQGDGASQSSESSKSEPSTPTQVPHGRRNAEAFKQLEHAHHTHVALHAGDICPGCLRGKVYKYQASTFTTISGRSPLVATRHTVDSLQCNQCNEVFRAPLPASLQADGVGGPTLYTYSAVAIVCILRCFGGLPMHRQDRLQRALGVPVPDSSIWDMHERLAQVLRPVWRFLVAQAADAKLFYGDDTGATILSLRTAVKPNRRTGKPTRRTGCHTTGVIAMLDGDHAAILFKTGIHHTGEVLDLLLTSRQSALPPPVFMGDCIASNTVTTATVYYAGCNAHAVRRFKELADRYPQHADFVLERYKQIYNNDAHCIEAQLDPTQRQAYHQKHSRPLLREITEYGEDLFEQRQVEPNSDFGEAMEYVITNERRLSAFTRHPGCPLDNNRVERALRTSVRLRETGHFFRNAVGAGVADTILTVGATALGKSINLFDYFVALQRHAGDVRESPELWVPWRYRDRVHTLTGADPPPANAPPLVAVT